MLMAFWFDSGGNCLERPCHQPPLTIDEMCAQPFSEEAMTKHHHLINRGFAGQDSLKTAEKHGFVERFRKPGEQHHFLRLTELGKYFVEELFRSRANEILEKATSQNNPDDSADARYARRTITKDMEAGEQLKPTTVASSSDTCKSESCPLNVTSIPITPVSAAKLPSTARASKKRKTPTTPPPKGTLLLTSFFRVADATVTPPNIKRQCKIKIEDE